MSRPPLYFLAAVTAFVLPPAWAGNITAMGGDISGGGGGLMLSELSLGNSGGQIAGYHGESPEKLFEMQQEVIGASRLHAQGYSGKGVTVAILDSGISPSSPAAKNVVAFKDFTTDRPRSTIDGHSHGTFVADLIHQTAPDAKLVIGRVLRAMANGDPRSLINGLSWILSNRKKYGIQIVNISLGDDETVSGSWNDSDEIRDQIHKLVQAGVHVVVAAGNEARSFLETAPANSPDALTVGSINYHFSTDRDDEELSPFTNFGSASQTKTEHFHFLGFDSISRDDVLPVTKPEILAPGQWIAARIEPGSTLGKYLEKITRLQNAKTRDETAGIESEIIRDAAASPIYSALSGLGPDAFKNLLLNQPQRPLQPDVALLSGTSFSSPMVAGSLALILQAVPHVTPSRIKQAVSDGSAPPFFNRSQADGSVVKYDEKVSSGLVGGFDASQVLEILRAK